MDFEAVSVNESREIFPVVGVASIVAVKLSNIKLPWDNLNFGSLPVVLKPASVASNGGEVSVGGQHNIRLSVGGCVVTVKFPPDAIGFTNASSIVILNFSGSVSGRVVLVLVAVIFEEPPSKADPCASQEVFTASKLSPGLTKSTVFPGDADLVNSKHRVSAGKQ